MGGRRWSMGASCPCFIISALPPFLILLIHQMHSSCAPGGLRHIHAALLRLILC